MRLLEIFVRGVRARGGEGSGTFSAYVGEEAAGRGFRVRLGRVWLLLLVSRRMMVEETVEALLEPRAKHPKRVS